MALTTDQEKMMKELMAARELFTQMKTLAEGQPKLLERIKALETFDERFKDIDPKSVLAKLDQLHTGMEQVKAKIRTNKNALFIPGLEDEAEKFSLLRACCAVKMGSDKAAFEKAGAGFEWEVIQAAMAKASSTGHVVGIGTQGGFFVPDQVIADVIAPIYGRSVFVSLLPGGATRVSVLDGLVGGTTRIPKFNGGVIAYWIGEEDAYVESVASTGNVSITPKKMGVLIRITDEMRRFSSYGFETLLRSDMTRASALKLDYTVAYGKGTENQPKGLVNLPGAKYYRAEDGTVLTRTAALAVSDWDGGELDFDDLDEMKGALEDANIVEDASAAIISAPRYFRRLKKIKVENYSSQTSGQPYLLGAPMLKDETLRGLIGAFDKSTQIPTTAKPGASIGGTTDSTNEKYGDVFYGNWSEVLLARWGGIEIEDDAGKGTGFIKDQGFVKLRMFADVGYRHEESIVICPDAKMRA
jgi:HK97 family phage major capsid protein